MIKKIIILCLVLLLLFSVSGCSGNKKEIVKSVNDKDEIKLVEDEIVYDESIAKKEIENIENEFLKGNMDEAEYHSKKIEALILSNERIKNEEISIKENPKNIPIDLSYDLQWMSDNYENLDKEQKEIFDKINNLYVKNENNISIINRIIRKAYADEGEEPYEAEFSDKVKFYAENFADGIIYHSIIYDAYEKCSVKYNDFFKTELNSKIKITVAPFDLALESFSYEFLDVYHIYINSNISNDFMVGSLYHEMFHVYQANLGYHRFDKLQNFIMESTAIWAVTYVDEDLGYHIRYSDRLYENPILDIENITLEDTYSWYQLYYFIYQEKGDFNLVQSIVLNMVNETDFAKGITKILGEEYRMHNLVAYFGQYLFAEKGISDIVFKDSSIMGDYTFDDSIINESSVMDIKNGLTDNGWHKEFFDDFGYKIYHVSHEIDKDAILSIVSDVGNEEGTLDKKAGMIIFGKNNDKWKLLLSGRYDAFTTSIDFIKDDIEDLMIVFFSYDSINQVNHAYQWNYEDLISGEGRINLNVKINRNSGVDIDNEEYEIRIIENIEKYRPDSNDEMKGYDSLILGDIYKVSNMQVIYEGFSEFYNESEDGGSTEIIKDSYGIFDYNEGDLPEGAFENNLLNLPPLPGLSSDNPGSLINNATDMLKGIEGMEGLEGIPDMGAELDKLNIEISEIDELDTVKNILKPIDSLIRIKKDESIDTFHIYKVLPNTIQSEKWIHDVEEITVRDKDGDVVDSVIESDNTITGDIFKVWFHNSFYNPDLTQSALINIDKSPEELAEDYKSSEDVMNQIAAINGVFDKSNLYKLINNGPSSIDMALINFKYEGDQIQEIKFENNIISGYIEAFYIDENGNEFDIEIEIDYDFSD